MATYFARAQQRRLQMQRISFNPLSDLSDVEMIREYRFPKAEIMEL